MRLSNYLSVPLMLIAAAVAAQPNPSSPFGSRVMPREPTTAAQILEVTPAQRNIVPFIFPLLLDTEGLRVGKLTAGAIFGASGERPLRLGLGYTYLDPDGADHLDRFSLSVNSTLVKATGGRLSFVGEYGDGKDLPGRLDAGIYGEIKIPGPTTFSLALATDLKWARKNSSAESVDDLIAAPKVLLEYGSFGAGAEYVTDNDVDGEDDYSLELNYTLVNGASLALIGGKNNTVIFYAFKTF